MASLIVTSRYNVSAHRTIWVIDSDDEVAAKPMLIKKFAVCSLHEFRIFRENPRPIAPNEYAFLMRLNGKWQSQTYGGLGKPQIRAADSPEVAIMRLMFDLLAMYPQFAEEIYQSEVICRPMLVVKSDGTVLSTPPSYC